jgi:mono/diheme cytochrome c family protein
VGAWSALLLALLALLAAGCYNNNTGDINIGGDIRFKGPAFPEAGPNVVQVFSEMHYQPSYRAQEIPRLLPHPDAVPVTGKELPLTTVEEYRALRVPEHLLADQAATVARGERLFRLNCLVCHGENLDGLGPVNNFPRTRGAAPRNLVAPDAAARTAPDGEVFGWISYGGQPGLLLGLQGRPSPTWMPQFKYLLTEDERWAILLYIRSEQGIGR